MATTTTTRFSKVDLTEHPGTGATTHRKIILHESNKFTIRIPNVSSYGSSPFDTLIHFTITLKIEER